MMSPSNGNEKAEQVVEEIKKEAGELGREIRQRAEDVKKETVKQLHTAAETIRKEVREAKVDKEAVQKADKLAKNLEKTAHYLNTHSVDQMGEQATRVVTKNPMRAVIIALVIGFLLGLMLRGDNK
jgi:ElaB/YqjD/DUF883 family membrane-anchored ribosome-binding protein